MFKRVGAESFGLIARPHDADTVIRWRWRTSTRAKMISRLPNRMCSKGSDMPGSADILGVVSPVISAAHSLQNLAYFSGLEQVFKAVIGRTKRAAI